jgi:hypothetical protein
MPICALIIAIKIWSMKLSSILAKEYKVVFSSGFAGNVSFKDLKNVYNTSPSKEVKRIIMKMMDAKTWMYALAIVGALIFIASRFV